jgi:hypothetical protein
VNSFLESGESYGNDEGAAKEEALDPHCADPGELQALDAALEHEHGKEGAEHVESTFELRSTEEGGGKRRQQVRGS